MLFSIDSQQCKRDGVCAAECPLGIIDFKDKDSVPKPVANAEELCIHCGHCVAVCPHGALSHADMTPEQCPPVRKEFKLNPEQTEHFLRSRRSIRVYKDKPADKDVLAKLIDIARYAPSGHNGQPVKWIVVQEAGEVQKLVVHVADWMRFMIKEQPDFARAFGMNRVLAAYKYGMDVICRSAPHLIIVHAPKKDVSAPVSCTIAMTYLELAAPAFGLGACWAGYFNAALGFWQPLQKALEIPEGHSSYGAMMVGYPKFHYHRLPLRKNPEIKWR